MRQNLTIRFFCKIAHVLNPKNDQNGILIEK